jgi:hypothetical protein
MRAGRGEDEGRSKVQFDMTGDGVKRAVPNIDRAHDCDGIIAHVIW